MYHRYLNSILRFLLLSSLTLLAQRGLTDPPQTALPPANTSLCSTALEGLKLTLETGPFRPLTRRQLIGPRLGISIVDTNQIRYFYRLLGLAQARRLTRSKRERESDFNDMPQQSRVFNHMKQLHWEAPNLAREAQSQTHENQTRRNQLARECLPFLHPLIRGIFDNSGTYRRTMGRVHLFNGWEGSGFLNLVLVGNSIETAMPVILLTFFYSESSSYDTGNPPPVYEVMIPLREIDSMDITHVGGGFGSDEFSISNSDFLNPEDPELHSRLRVQELSSIQDLSSTTQPTTTPFRQPAHPNIGHLSEQNINHYVSLDIGQTLNLVGILKSFSPLTLWQLTRDGRLLQVIIHDSSQVAHAEAGQISESIILRNAPTGGTLWQLTGTAPIQHIRIFDIDSYDRNAVNLRERTTTTSGTAGYTRITKSLTSFARELHNKTLIPGPPP